MHHDYQYSIDAERQVLATLVQYPSTSEDVVRKMLGPESFYIPANQYIFSSVLSLLANHKPVGFTAVKEALVATNRLQELGGPETLSELWSLTAPADTIEHYAEIVAQKDLLRRLIIGARKVIEIAQEPGTEFSDVRDQVEAVLTALSMQRDRPEKSLKERTLEWIDALATRAESLKSNSFAFGIPRVDRNVGPIRPGDFVLISAATSRGKSLAAFQGALSTAMRG
jgi:replicative DNA helicase